MPSAIAKDWEDINKTLMSTTDERKVQAMLNRELKGAKRETYVKRIKSRLNRLRAARERKELERQLGR